MSQHLINALDAVSFAGPEAKTEKNISNHLFNALEAVSLAGPEDYLDMDALVALEFPPLSAEDEKRSSVCH